MKTIRSEERGRAATMKLRDIRTEDKNSNIACPLCGKNVQIIAKRPLGELVGVHCENCLTYYLRGTVFDKFNDAEHAYLLSRYFKNYRPDDAAYACYDADGLNSIIASEKAMKRGPGIC